MSAIRGQSGLGLLNLCSSHFDPLAAIVSATVCKVARWGHLIRRPSVVDEIMGGCVAVDRACLDHTYFFHCTELSAAVPQIFAAPGPALSGVLSRLRRRGRS